MNRYLEKIAVMSPAAKMFAKKVIAGVGGDSSKINSVYNAASVVVSKRMSGVYSSAEKTNITSKLKGQADKLVGPNKLYSGEAVRAARAGARLARIQAKKAA